MHQWLISCRDLPMMRVLLIGRQIRFDRLFAPICSSPADRDHFELMPPHQEVPLKEAGACPCSKDAMRHQRETGGTRTSPSWWRALLVSLLGTLLGEGSDCC